MNKIIGMVVYFFGGGGKFDGFFIPCYCGEGLGKAWGEVHQFGGGGGGGGGCRYMFSLPYILPLILLVSCEVYGLFNFAPCTIGKRTTIKAVLNC